jgi:hypothetical protein
MNIIPLKDFFPKKAFNVNAFHVDLPNAFFFDM